MYRTAEMIIHVGGLAMYKITQNSQLYMFTGQQYKHIKCWSLFNTWQTHFGRQYRYDRSKNRNRKIKEFETDEE